MGEATLLRQRMLRVAAAVALAGLAGACAGDPSGPAPLIMKGDEAGFPGAAPGAAMSGRAFAPLPASRGEARRIVVRPGQSLSRIALEYHVPVRAIVAANHLTPPYKIEIGQLLLIAGAGGSPSGAAIAALPPPASGHSPPAIIPLDGPAPPATIMPQQPAASRSLPPEPSAAEEAREEASGAPRPASRAEAPLPHGGRLPWPVQGRVLAGYGVAAGGAHNDGINIAAPRGAPVRAVDAGVVAYAGNELRGYGNLVLVKHRSGFISAYAHCEELLVKKGDNVARGQVIAKVGATGGVSEPQLHFELRRGKSAVDPRAFLAPAPSAAGRDAPRPG